MGASGGAIAPVNTHGNDFFDALGNDLPVRDQSIAQRRDEQ
ncbi:MAG TPA: hypothetical protein VJY34_22105 [Roseiarcus sp.]|nr:hypothetical protein [Roseiarcus sp.]